MKSLTTAYKIAKHISTNSTEMFCLNLAREAPLLMGEQNELRRDQTRRWDVALGDRGVPGSLLTHFRLQNHGGTRCEAHIGESDHTLDGLRHEAVDWNASEAQEVVRRRPGGLGIDRDLRHAKAARG